MTAMSALLLADGGELDFEDPVTKYWPEFGVAGKGDTQVKHFILTMVRLNIFWERLAFG